MARGNGRRTPRDPFARLKPAVRGVASSRAALGITPHRTLGLPLESIAIPRLMARLYAQIWAMTATIEAGPAKDWKVTWGRQDPYIPTAKGSAAEVFDGAPDIPIRKPSKKRGTT